MQTIKLLWYETIPENYTGIVELFKKEEEKWIFCEKFWYKEGKLHREDGPASEHANGTKYWYKEGNLHRLDGPAVERLDGTKYWYKEGKFHRLDGPAVEYANGDKYWYKEGKFHRLDGPAIGCSTWYIDGVKYKGSKILETLLLRSVFLSINKNGKYNIPWLSFLTEQGITEFPILPNYPFTTKCLEFLQSLSITLSTPPLIKE